MDSRIISAVRNIVALLVAKDYNGIARLTGARRCDADSIKSAVQEYGRQLVMPPDSVFDRLDSVRVANTELPQWSVRVDLWDIMGGRSDLSLELTVIVDGANVIIECDGIHVL
jgi:hypothetical protein